MGKSFTLIEMIKLFSRIEKQYIQSRLDLENMHRRKEIFTATNILLKDMHRGIRVKGFFKRNEKAHLNKIEVGHSMKLIIELVALIFSFYLPVIYRSCILTLYTPHKMKISNLGPECSFKNSKRDNLLPLIACLSYGIQDIHINFLVFFLEVR